MEFRVLGPIELSEGERRVAIGPRMQRAILALLLIDANRVVPVDRLVDALWGAEPPPTAVTALQGYISNLRRLLEPGRPPRTPPQVLVTQAPGYLLRVGPGAFDAAQFEALASEGRTYLASGHAADATRALRGALGLWRGLPYADLAFETFVQPEITRLNERRATATEDLMEASLALGQHVAVAAELERLAAAEPLRERRWELLVLALYRSGRQADALRAYTHARTTLAEELGIEPRPSLRALEADILRHAPTLDWEPHVNEGAVAHPAVTHPPGDLPNPKRPSLVGRQDELKTLETFLAEAITGRGHVVLVSGEPGVGKTRLVEELVQRAGDQGAAVAWGRSVEGETPAFWPWVQIVRGLAVASGPELMAAALRPVAAEVAQIVPELKELVELANPPHVLDLETARLRLYDAVTSFLVRLAEQRPLLVVLDDLQWADLASVRLLQFLAACIASARLVVVATHRDVDVGFDHPLTAALGALARTPTVSRLGVSGLADAHITQLAVEAVGVELDPRLAADLHGRTEGNPFFLVELLRLLGEHGSGTDLEKVLRSAIPTGVRDVIRDRVGRLSDQTAALLAVAAVVGRDFDLDVLARAAGLHEDAAVELVEEALAGAILVEHPDQGGTLRFSHDLVRETLYDGLSAIRKTRTHRSVGEALEALGRTDGVDAAAIADHFWRGVAAGAVDKAFTYALRAAEQDTNALAYEHAEQHLRRALTLLGRLPADADRAQSELVVQDALGLVLLMTRGYSASEVGQTVARTVELCRQVGDRDRLLVATWRLLSFHILRAEYASTRQLATSLVDHEQEVGNRVFAATGYRALGAVAFSEGGLIEAREHLQRAIALIDAEPDPPRVGAFEVDPGAFARDFLALDLCLLGEAARAEQVMDEALAAARHRGDPFTVSFSLYLAASLAVFQGDAPRARYLAEEAFAVATKHGYGLTRAIADTFRAWAASELGDRGVATNRMKHGLEAAGSAGAAQWRHFLLALLAQALWRRGRPRAALSVLDNALAHTVTTGERFYEPEVHRLRAEILLGVSPDANRREAEAALRRAASVARSQSSVLFLERAETALRRMT